MHALADRGQLCFRFPCGKILHHRARWSNGSAMAPRLKMYPPGRCIMSSGARPCPSVAWSPIALAPDSVPCNAMLPTNAVHPADMRSIVPAKHVYSSCAPRSNKTHNTRAYASWRVAVILCWQESQMNMIGHQVVANQQHLMQRFSRNKSKYTRRFASLSRRKRRPSPRWVTWCATPTAITRARRPRIRTPEPHWAGKTLLARDRFPRCSRSRVLNLRCLF